MLRSGGVIRVWLALVLAISAGCSLAEIRGQSRQIGRCEDHLESEVTNLGRVVSLDDLMFSPKNYSMGMWRPLDFLNQVGGGLLLLQRYEADKTPVIFLHGVNGGPTDLKNLIDRLDRGHFQPWVLYYPSGVRLEMISEYFVTAVAAMQNRYGVKRFAVVGHSMGGLITRSFVKKYVEQYPERRDNVVLVMTINSPLGGIPSAAHGINSPVVIQSWRDVAPGSDFLKNVTGWTWPAAIPYYLIFSYQEGQDGDGVVSMGSQIPLKLQQEAVRTYGFNNSHEEIVNNDSFLRLFTSIIDSVAR